MNTKRVKKKSKYSTVSLPRRLTDEIRELIGDLEYWVSVGSFVREATLEKLRREKQTPEYLKILDELKKDYDVPVPILALEPQEGA